MKTAKEFKIIPQKDNTDINIHCGEKFAEVWQNEDDLILVLNENIPALVAALSSPSSVGQVGVSDEDLKEWPYEGMCGKCGRYWGKLNESCLCEECLSFGVRPIEPISDEIMRTVRLRYRLQTGGDGVAFAEWITENYWIRSSDDLWYWKNDGNPSKGITTPELYEQFKSLPPQEKIQ